MTQDYLSEDLVSWLENAMNRLEIHKDTKVVVISIVGKDSQTIGNAKSDIINTMVNKHVFPTAWTKSCDHECSIDVYFNAETRCIFLHLNGMFDMNSAISTFVDGQDCFFETVAKLELSHMRLLLFLFFVSHIVVFVEPCCRFDLAYARMLRNLNFLRNEISPTIQNVLSKIPSIPKEMANETRMCTPRMLFAFQRSPLRADLGTVKRKELTEKLQRSMEDQIYEILRKSRIVTNNCTFSIGSIPPNTPFVYIFLPDELPRDPLKELIDSLHEIVEVGNFVEDENKKKRRFEDGFGVFLTAHIDEAIRSGFNDNVGKSAPVSFFQLPKLKHFIRTANSIYMTIMDKADNIFAPMFDVEIEFSVSRCKKMLPNAFNSYLQDLPQYYPRQHHEIKLSQALQYLTTHSRGPNLQHTVEKLTEKCCSYWKDGRQACEALSLTGNHCSNQIHKLVGDFRDEREDVPILAHSSKARFLSACNCGYNQLLRADPFTLKEANHDFYENPEFVCCHLLDRYEFEIFQPESITENAKHDSREESGLFRRLRVESGDDQNSDDGQLEQEMLPDRDNKLAGDEIGLDGWLFEGIAKDDSVPLSDNEPIDDVSDYSHSEINSSSPVLVKKKTKKTKNMDESEDSSDSETDDHSEEVDDFRPSSGLAAKSTPLLDEHDESDHEQMARIEAKFAGMYLQGMPHSQNAADLNPLFPSWAVVCLGSSSIYTHAIDMPNFSHGAHYLLPWDVTLKVDGDDWDRKMGIIVNQRSIANVQNRSRRTVGRSGDRHEKVKVFVGFEYECPRGHRFMLETPKRAVKHTGAGGPKDSASVSVRNDMPIWFPCTCRSSPRVNGQLMRLHVVTPKAPVNVTINPRVQPNSDSHLYFHPGAKGLVQLTWGKYYVVRLPYSYSGPDGPIYPPAGQMIAGRILKGVLTVVEAETV